MTELSKAEADRREFLKAAGRFAVIVPPTMTFLLSTTLEAKAIAISGGGSGCNSGNGDNLHSPFGGDGDCDPGNSGDHNQGNDPGGQSGGHGGGRGRGH